jgi:FtsZ-binding cell division protein ZapB|tara:strand:+ start:1143 stop:1334 length:192 start_codon:yes stop_codon:yes gene_type:complete
MEMPEQLVIEKLKSEIKSLQYDCAELQKKNDELTERCKKLASRQPSWPRGYQPKRYTPKHRQQ